MIPIAVSTGSKRPSAANSSSRYKTGWLGLVFSRAISVRLWVTSKRNQRLNAEIRSGGITKKMVWVWRFRSAKLKSDVSSTFAILGLSKKWVWRCKVDSTAEASLSFLLKKRFAHRAINPLQDSEPCIVNSNSENCWAGRVIISRKVSRFFR